MDLPREDQLLRIGVAEVLDTNEEMTLNAVLRDGSDSNLMLAGGAAMGGEVVAQLATVVEGTFLDTAIGARLEKLVWDRYGLLKKPAAAAMVDLEFSTTIANPTAFTIPGGTIVTSSDGKQYRTVADVVFPAGSTGPVTVTARAELAGSDQMVRAGTLINLVTQIAGQPADLEVTNPTASAGGAERERDDELRARARRFWRAFRGGVKDAIEFAGLSVPGVVRATAFEGLDMSGRPNRIVTLVVADRFTDALVRQGVAVPAYETQSQAFAKTVFAGLDEWRAFGVWVQVIVAQVVLVPATLRLRFRAGADTSLATIMARATFVDFVNSLRPGESFDPAALIQRLKAVPGLDVRGDELENPAGVVATSSPYQVLRTTLSIVQTTTAGTATASLSLLPA